MRAKKNFSTPYVGKIDKDGWAPHDQWPACLEVQKACKRGDASKYLDHNGWYTDSFCNGVYYACAVRVRVPRRLVKRGETRVRWLEAISHSDWDSISISRKWLHEEIRDCIRSADDTAKDWAETAREDDAAYQAESLKEGLRDYIKDTRAGILEALSERKGATDGCRKLIHIFVIERLTEIRKARKRIATLEANYWEAVPC